MTPEPTPSHDRVVDVARAPGVPPPIVRALVLSALFGAVLVLAGSMWLWDRDETYYARTAVEMARSGDWVVPSYNGQTFGHKPPLMYWLMGSSIKALGNSEFAVRLPSAVALLLTALLTGAIGRRMFSPLVGWWSTLVMMTAGMPMLIGAAAMLDMVLLLFITLGVWSIVVQLDRPKAWRWAWAPLSVAMAGSMLTKFPIGPAVLGPMAVVSAVLARRVVKLGVGPWVGGFVSIILGCAAFAAWAVPANRATGGEMAEVGLMKHIVGRALSPMEGHGGSGVGGYLATLLVYVPVLIAGLFPWVLHAPAGVSALVRKHVGGVKQRAILWGWIAPTFVMFSLAATKLPHYILPIFPAMAILIAATLEARSAGRLSEKDRDWLRGGIWFYLPVAAIGVVGLAYGGFALADTGGAATAVIIVAGFAAVSYVLVRWQLRESVWMVSRVLVVATPLVTIAGVLGVVRSLELKVKPGPLVAMFVEAKGVSALPTYAYGYREPGLMYYLDRPVDAPVLDLPGTAEEMTEWLASTEPAVLIITAERHKALSESFEMGRLRQHCRVRTINPNDGGAEQTILVLRRGSR